MEPKSADAAIRLENIGRVFGKAAAIHDLSLEIKRGEIVSLVGHSGCGKSTLLRIIAGVERSSRGQVILDGQVVDGQSFVEPEQRSVGLVFQDYALFPHLSARDNIMFGLKRRPRQEALRIATDVIRRVGIEHLADRFPHTLSGGEQQRVALARALAPEPAVLLMDEPFSNLDQGLRERVRNDTLSLLRGLGATVVMVTHDPEEALSCGDRVVLMHAGEIVQSGSPVELYSQPTSGYAAEFFCGSTKVSGHYREGFVETVIGNFAHPSTGQRQGPCTIYIRPRAVRVGPDLGDLTAQVVQRSFRGDHERLMLRLEGLEPLLTADVDQPLPADLTMIKVSVLPEKLLVF